MTPHQSFTDLCAIAIAYGSGKVSIIVAQSIPSPDWIDKITGPLGALVTMAIGILYLSQRNAKQDAKMEERQKQTDAREDAATQARIETIQKLSETIAQNNAIIEKNSRALDKHPCHK